MGEIRTVARQTLENTEVDSLAPHGKPRDEGYTREELSHLLQQLPLEAISVHTEITSADYLSASAIPPLNAFYRLILRCAGYSRTWDPSWYVNVRVPANQFPA